MAVHAESSIQLNTIPANTSLLGGHFLYKSSNTVKQGVITTTTGAGVIQNLDSDPANWGYNTWIGSNSIQLRYGETADATLSTNGLVLSKGGISAKEGLSDFVYLSSEDYPLKDDSATPAEAGLTINSHTPTAAGTDGKLVNDPAWRQVVGTKFGVDSEGNLYAANANISGIITATGGTIGGCSISNGVLQVAAANITSGTIADARIPSLAISKITDLSTSLVSAGNTANSFIYYTSSTGLKLAQSNPDSATSNYVNITSTAVSIIKDSTHKSVLNSSGMQVYSGDSTNAIAQFGSTITLGKTNSPHMVMSANGDFKNEIDFYTSTSTITGTIISDSSSSGSFIDIGSGNGYITINSSAIQLGFTNGVANLFHSNGQVDLYSSTTVQGYVESQGYNNIRLVASTSSSSYKGIYDPDNSSWMWCLKYGETDRYRTAGHIMPNSDNDLYMGLANNRWKAVYAANGTIQTSDTKAKDILGTIDYAEDLIMGLEPVDFMWKDGDHRRKRMGFKAQQSAQLCKELNQNLAFVTATYKEDDDLPYYGEDVDDELLNWGMVKEELIAPLVKVVQNQQKEIQKLKTQVQNLSLMIQGE